MVIDALDVFWSEDAGNAVCICLCIDAYSSELDSKFDAVDKYIIDDLITHDEID